MSVRILGGVAKGRGVSALNRSDLRPTSSMLKRKLFDSYQNLTDICFIDLCAGSGNVGLEALSRGAKEVIFVEKNRSSFKGLQDNLRRFSLEFSWKNFSSFNKSFQDFLKSFSGREDQKYLFFFDPPYELHSAYDDFFEMVSQLPAHSLYVVEACVQKTCKLEIFQEKYGVPKKVFKQGTSFFAVFELDSDHERH